MERHYNRHGRLEFVDCAKLVALIAVIASHSMYGNSPFKILYPCYIAVFFICAGYTTSTDKPIDLREKFRKLIVPYFYLNILLVFTGVIFDGWDWNGIWGVIYSRFCLNPVHSPNNVYLLIYNNAPTWFLTALFAAYAYYAVLLKFKPKYRTAVAALYVVAGKGCECLPILLPWSLDSAMLFAAFMYVGRLMRRYDLLSQQKAAVSVCCGLTYVGLLLSRPNICWNLSIREYGWSIMLLITMGYTGSQFLLYCCKFIPGKISATISTHQQPLAIFGLQGLFIFLISYCKEHISGAVVSDTTYGIVQISASLIGGYFVGKLLSKRLNPQQTTKN